MVDRIPITSAAQLVHLDDDEVLQGYVDGHSGDPMPGDNRTDSYWHGWRNGHADRTGLLDEAQRLLAHDYVKSKVS